MWPLGNEAEFQLILLIQAEWRLFMIGQKKEKRTIIVNSIVCVTIVCFIFYSVVQLSRNLPMSLSTLRTQEITDNSYVSLKGYIIRDEHVIDIGESSIADFFVGDGERVAVGTEFAKVFKVSGMNSEDIKSKRTELEGLARRIDMLEASVSGSVRVADIKHIIKNTEDEYLSFINSVFHSDYVNADYSGDRVLGGINDYLVATGRLEKANSIISSLKAEKNALIASLGSATEQILSSDNSCYIYRTVDGYENVFNYDEILNMTYSEFVNSVSFGEPINSLGVIGKKVYNPKWYAVTIADVNTCYSFVEGQSYLVNFTDKSDMSLNMTVERICVSEDEREGGFIVFSCNRCPDGFDFSRTANMKVSVNSYTGYRVPQEAVVYLGSERGVYILCGNIVEFRRITVIGQGEGYYIVETYKNDAAQENPVQIPYLNFNDLIITAGRNLYDGKILK